MTVFTDFHHESLLESLILLFEKRLSGQVFRPIGLEWFYEGYWKINGLRDTAEQFLLPHSVPLDGTPPLNDDLSRCITLEQFFVSDIDAVVASLPQHIEPFRKLCELHPSRPKLIYQIGNQWEISQGVTNVLSSAKQLIVPDDINYLEYHQEFDLSVFYPSQDLPEKTVFSFINIFQEHRDFPLFIQCERRLREKGYQFASFGGQCRDGNITGREKLAAAMRSAMFIWHTKQGGDGYGHILHNAAAVGRPIIYRQDDYVGKMGISLLYDGVTGIAIDNLSADEIVEKIEYFSDPERYLVMCKNVRENFRLKVDFDKEEEQIREFLRKLI